MRKNYSQEIKINSNSSIPPRGSVYPFVMPKAAKVPEYITGLRVKNEVVQKKDVSVVLLGTLFLLFSFVLIGGLLQLVHILGH